MSNVISLNRELVVSKLDKPVRKMPGVLEEDPYIAALAMKYQLFAKRWETNYCKRTGLNMLCSVSFEDYLAIKQEII